MLERLLSTIERAAGPVSPEQLSRRLGIERSALDPMLELLVRKGRLAEWNQGGSTVVCGGRSCGTSCAEGCPFLPGGFPRTLTVKRRS